MGSSKANGGPLPSRRTSLRAAGLLVSLVSLTAVVWWASKQAPPTFPSSAGQIGALLGAIAAYAVASALRAERWLRLLRRSAADPPRADCYALTAVGYMGNNVLPARGGDAMRVYLMAPRARTGMRTVIGTLVAERLLDVLTLLALFCVLAYGVLRGVETPSDPVLAISVGILAALGLAALGAILVARRSAHGRRLLELVRPMVAATRDLRGRYGASMVALTFVIWLLEALTYRLVGASIGLAMTPIEALYLVALASIFLLIPAGPGYAGTLDAGVIFGTRAIGATGSQAVSYLLMLRFVLMVPITLVGLLLLLVRYGWRPLTSGARAGVAGT